MKLKSVLQFEKRRRQPDGDTPKWDPETDRNNVLLDRHGKPVLDKDGHPVYVERGLGRRPLLNNESAADDGEDGSLRIPPEETVPLPDDEDAGLPDAPAVPVPEEEPAPHSTDRLALLLETAGDD